MDNQLSDSEIIAALGGPTRVARMVKVKPPSVVSWASQGIPDGRLIELAARIERVLPGRFSRQARWPERYAEIWPELAEVSPNRAPVASAQAQAAHG